MVEGMAYETATSKSDIAVMAIEGMFNNMPQERQEKYAKSSEKYHKSKKDQLWFEDCNMNGGIETHAY